MFLKTLVVTSSEGNLIRQVDFKKHLNVILVQTTDTPQSSTNSVGKTTVLRSVDFCLAGDVKQLYQDSEYKTDNETVLGFFQQMSPFFSLTLGLFENSNNDVRISRQITVSADNHKVSVKNHINEKKYTNTEFKKALSKRRL